MLERMNYLLHTYVFGLNYINSSLLSVECVHDIIELLTMFRTVMALKNMSRTSLVNI